MLRCCFRSRCRLRCVAFRARVWDSDGWPIATGEESGDCEPLRPGSATPQCWLLRCASASPTLSATALLRESCGCLRLWRWRRAGRGGGGGEGNDGKCGATAGAGALVGSEEQKGSVADSTQRTTEQGGGQTRDRKESKGRGRWNWYLVEELGMVGVGRSGSEWGCYAKNSKWRPGGGGQIPKTSSFTTNYCFCSSQSVFFVLQRYSCLALVGLDSLETGESRKLN
jgi:hypothetical protein